MVTDDHRSPDTVTAYREDALEAEYGTVNVERDTFTVSAEKYERMQRKESRDAIGGARVLLNRGTDEVETLLVSNRGEPGWDIPGGAREAGEPPEETAVREVKEEVNLNVQLQDALQAFDWGFVPENRDDAERVSGLWIHFEGTLLEDESAVTIQEEELLDAEWFSSAPENIDPPAEPIVRAAVSANR